jgi:hypothetical protein
MGVNCVSFPAFLMRVRIIPEGIPFVVYLVLALAALALRVCLLVAVALPLATLTLIVSASGICVAFLALWAIRATAWVSVLVVLACVNICTVLFGGAMKCLLRMQALTMRYRGLDAPPPPPPLPTASLHAIRTLHVLMATPLSSTGGAAVR